MLDKKLAKHNKLQEEKRKRSAVKEITINAPEGKLKRFLRVQLKKRSSKGLKNFCTIYNNIKANRLNDLQP